jgi:hypothetical protein
VYWFPVLAVLIAAALAVHSTPFSDGRPPSAFQHDATVTVEFAGQQKIDDTCHPLFGAPPKGMRTMACDTGKKVLMPNPCTYPESDRYAHLLCHELGHVNGWPPTHGDFPPTPVSGPRPPQGPPPTVGAAAG